MSTDNQPDAPAAQSQSEGEAAAVDPRQDPVRLNAALSEYIRAQDVCREIEKNIETHKVRIKELRAELDSAMAECEVAYEDLKYFEQFDELVQAADETAPAADSSTPDRPANPEGWRSATFEVLDISESVLERLNASPYYTLGELCDWFANNCRPAIKGIGAATQGDLSEALNGYAEDWRSAANEHNSRVHSPDVPSRSSVVRDPVKVEALLDRIDSLVGAVGYESHEATLLDLLKWIADAQCYTEAQLQQVNNIEQSAK